MGYLPSLMVASHAAAHDCYARAARIAEHRGDLAPWREGVNAATKLTRTVVALGEGLDRHRGKSGQQNVRVEHVTVNDGGQAIVGNIEAPGRGDERGIGKRPHAERTFGPAVWRPDPERDPLPRAGDGKRSVSDAQRNVTRRPARQPSKAELTRDGSYRVTLECDL